MQRFTFREQLAAAMAAIISSVTVAVSTVGATIGNLGTTLI
ncbi:MAG: hypothetical protein ABJN65_17395 [Parasphingorhabdus sp.]